jgi:hypothetical protein
MSDQNWTEGNFGIRYCWTERNVLCQRWNGKEWIDLTVEERIKYGFPPKVEEG